MVYPSLATLGVAGVALGSIALASQQPTSKPPNVLFLFTDDQDLLLGSLKYVDAITNRVQSHGAYLLPTALARYDT